MGPAPTPPWRVLEGPDEDGPDVAAGAPAGDEAGPARRGLDPSVLRAAGVFLAAAVLALIAFVLATTSGSGDGVAVDSATASTIAWGASPDAGAVGLGPSTAGVLVVEVTGAVARPGVFRLPAGSRVVDLVETAGGYGPRVDTARAQAEVNLAAALQDGDRVHVPSRDDPPIAVGGDLAAGSGSGAPVTTGVIDLNTATVEQLDTLPGIGPVTAEKILAARAEAPFGAVEELRTRGILGEKTFERIRELVTAG